MKHRSPRKGTLLAAVAVASLSVVSTLAQDKFRITGLGTLPGGSSSYSNALNNAGQATGYSTVSGAISHAFRYSNGTMLDLGALPNDLLSVGNDINNQGFVVGFSSAPANQHAAYFDGTSVVDIGTFPDGNFSIGQGINDSGQIVGYGNRGVGIPNQAAHEKAFLYSNGVMTDLGTLGGNKSYANAINNAGTVVGWSQTTTPNDRAFIRAGSQLVAIDPSAGYLNSYGYAVNSSGMVAGRMSNGNLLEAFIYDGTQTIPLGVLPGVGPNNALPTSSVDSSRAINDLGMVVGVSGVLGNFRAFLYANGQIHDLNLLQTAPGWRLDFARGINIHGQVSGKGQLTGVGERAYIGTPELHWQSGSGGNWDGANAWSWGVAPSNPHPVYVNRSLSGSTVVIGPAANTTIAELNIGTTGSGSAELQLQSNGALTLSPGIAGNGLVTVGSRGTLAGSGTISGNVVIQTGGRLSPGTGPGQITVDGSITLQSISNLDIDLEGDPNAPNAAGVTFDIITVTGTGNTFHVGGSNLNVIPHSGVQVGQQYVIVKAVNGATINHTQSFANLIAGLTYSSGGVAYTVSYSSDEITVTFSSVPEPGCMVPVLTASCLLRRRRRAD